MAAKLAFINANTSESVRGQYGLNTRRCMISLFAMLAVGTGISACGQPETSADNSNTAASNAAANSSDNATAATTTPTDFGILGNPQENKDAWDGADPKFDTQSVKSKLALFRKNERLPLQGDETHFVTWQEIEERESLQRALFYAVETTSPELLTEQDRRWLKADEKGLIESECENRGADGTMYNLSEKQCAGVVSATDASQNVSTDVTDAGKNSAQ